MTSSGATASVRLRPASAAAALALALALASALAAPACGGGDDAPAGDDGRPADARGDGPPPDARPIDARPIDAREIDAAFQCEPVMLTPAEACAAALTGEVQACSIDPGSGAPSQNGSLAVRRPDGSTGYLCANMYTVDGGYYFNGDRVHLVDAAAACCGGPPGTVLDWPAPDVAIGIAHGPTHVKPWETATTVGGELRENPFAIVVSNQASAAAFQEARMRWMQWAGDGQPHPAPDGTGRYWFEPAVAINYVVVPTMAGEPIIVIAPEASLDPQYLQPIGHPTLGACGDHGGTPLAFIAGDIRQTTITNRSGRFGRDPSVSFTNLSNTMRLFNCYGITVTNFIYSPPS